MKQRSLFLLISLCTFALINTTDLKQAKKEAWQKGITNTLLIPATFAAGLITTHHIANMGVKFDMATAQSPKTDLLRKIVAKSLFASAKATILATIGGIGYCASQALKSTGDLVAIKIIEIKKQQLEQEKD
jgi:hypothetical protein